MGLKPSSRVFDRMDKINKLHSRYTDASEEISTLKSRKKEIKNKLKESRSDYEAIKSMELMKSERTLLKADKKTNIDALERVLEKTKREVCKLEKCMDMAFEMREKVKARVMWRIGFGEEGDGAAMAKMKNVGGEDCRPEILEKKIVRTGKTRMGQVKLK